MENNRVRRRALVTGASTGIGLEIARLAAADCYDLVIVARNGERLATLADELRVRHRVHVQPIILDLATPDAADRLLQHLETEGLLPLDALVNNAGCGAYGSFSKSSERDIVEMIQLNVTTLTVLTRRCLPSMLEQRRGRILNVASTAAFQPGPLMAVYYATKAFVLSLSEALDEEVRDSGVTVTALCPGPTRSEFQARAGMKSSKLARRASHMSARAVAECGWFGMLGGRRIVIPGVANRVLAHSVAFLPRRLVTRVVKGLQAEE